LSHELGTPFERFDIRATFIDLLKASVGSVAADAILPYFETDDD